LFVVSFSLSIMNLCHIYMFSETFGIIFFVVVIVDKNSNCCNCVNYGLIEL
jgi:hypothetical protein